MPDSAISILLTVIDQAFDHKSWHGTNLSGSIRGLSAPDVVWRPSVNGHNIWEIVVHTAYWKYVVLRRLLNEARGSFPLKGSNWFERPGVGVDEKAWKSDVALLRQTHERLRDAIASLNSSELEYKPAASKVSNLDLITGIASHDLYHAGQIQLLKRLQSREGESRRHV
jgi:uncharacterized damage-inducible protein DinB